MHPSSRRLLAAAALACFIGAFALTPLEVRSRAGERQPVALAQAPPLARNVHTDEPVGDPFVPRAVDADAPAAVVSPIVRPSPVVVHIDRSERARLLALVTGAHPEALIDDDGTTRLVGIGDRLEGAAIAGIGDGTVTFTDGRHIALSREAGRP
jgi:hypothetical protein